MDVSIFSFFLSCWKEGCSVGFVQKLLNFKWGASHRTFTIYQQISFFFHSILFFFLHKRRISSKAKWYTTLHQELSGFNVTLCILYFGSSFFCCFFPLSIYWGCKLCIKKLFSDSLAILQSWVECQRLWEESASLFMRHRNMRQF